MLLLDHASILDNAAQLGVLGCQGLVLFGQGREFQLTVLVCDLEGCIASNTSLLAKFLVLLVQLGTFELRLRKLVLSLVEVVCKLIELLFVLQIHGLDVLKLLTSVRKHDHMVDNLTTQTGELLVSLLDLLVESLVFNLQLFIIDQMKTFSKLLLLLEDLLLIGKSVSESNVLQTILMNLLVLSLVSFLPLFDHLGAQLLASSAVNGVHSDRALELLELLLDLSALGLLLVKLVLQLTSHAVVPILSLLQVVTDLMHVSKSVEVLMLVEHLVSLLLIVSVVMVHQDDLSLALFVELLKLLIFATLILNSRNQLSFHGRLTGKVTDTAIVVLIRIIAIDLVFREIFI